MCKTFDKFHVWDMMIMNIVLQGKVIFQVHHQL